MDTRIENRLINRLPNEIWQLIFTYIYPPFHLRYTQTHDHFPQSSWQQVLESVNLYDIDSPALMHELPRLGPLLVCRKFRDAGSVIFSRAFTAQVHIVGRMIFKTVHHSYGGLMALTKKVLIAEEFLWTFISLDFKGKMPKLERLIVMMPFMTAQDLVYEISNDDITVKVIKRERQKWMDVQHEDLFLRFGGLTSISYAVRERWEVLGIKTTYRYTHYAATEMDRTDPLDDMLVSLTSFSV